jgi:electron transfer flavoprotein alpha subunit
MSNYIVLVKQVPDVSQITDNVFNPETGTLIRSKLTNVINELDTQALAFANLMKSLSNDKDARVVALTMGPPSAAEVLRYSLARCCDSAVLLTDRKLGGADTWATGNPLAYAVRRIVKEIFGGSEDYYILSGMQSVDGDTAQVPPQVAQELSLPCITYATGVSYKDGHFEITRIISGGSQVVSPKKKPAVITVAKYEYPLFATFARTRKAGKVDLIEWGADDINATGIGVHGSKTQVTRVFPPGKTNRKCTEITDIKEFARLIIESSKADSAAKAADDQAAGGYILPSERANPFDRSFESLEKESQICAQIAEKLFQTGVTSPEQINDEKTEAVVKLMEGQLHENTVRELVKGFANMQPYYDGDVWVTAEHDGPKIHSSTFELIGKARELADSLHKKVGVVLAGSDVSALTESLFHAGADIVYLAQDKLLEEFQPAAYRKVIAAIIKKYKPQIVLYAATPRGRTLAPMIAYGLDCGLTADCTSLDIRDVTKKQENAILMQTRPALGGNIMATIYTKNSTCQMVTVRPGVMKAMDIDKNRKGELVECRPEVNEDDLDLNIIKTERSTAGAKLESEAIVTGGKGLQSQENYTRLLDGLTEAMRNAIDITVEKGASRAAVEQGFIDRAYQVGQTGTSIGPKIYIALGVSGAIQHMIGVANTETIFAVNIDPEAPILKQCDYYMINGVEKVVPELIKLLNEVK